MGLRDESETRLELSSGNGMYVAFPGGPSAAWQFCRLTSQMMFDRDFADLQALTLSQRSSSHISIPALAPGSSARFSHRGIAPA